MAAGASARSGFSAGKIRLTLAHWFTQYEHGGFPVERAALGSCDLSILHVGGEWQWLVSQAGRDVAEGAARVAVDAQRQAEAVALKLRLIVR